jgi:hypothetical protein
MEKAPDVIEMIQKNERRKKVEQNDSLAQNQPDLMQMASHALDHNKFYPWTIVSNTHLLSHPVPLAPPTFYDHQFNRDH